MCALFWYDIQAALDIYEWLVSAQPMMMSLINTMVNKCLPY